MLASKCVPEKDWGTCIAALFKDLNAAPVTVMSQLPNSHESLASHARISGNDIFLLLVLRPGIYNGNDD